MAQKKPVYPNLNDGTLFDAIPREYALQILDYLDSTLPMPEEVNVEKYYDNTIAVVINWPKARYMLMIHDPPQENSNCFGFIRYYETTAANSHPTEQYTPNYTLPDQLVDLVEYVNATLYAHLPSVGGV